MTIIVYLISLPLVISGISTLHYLKEKNNKIAAYNYIEPEDWYINWYTYYVNGEIYAAMDDESEYGSTWKTSLSTTQDGVVVSEKEDITIYNSKNNLLITTR